MASIAKSNEPSLDPISSTYVQRHLKAGVDEKVNVRRFYQLQMLIDM